MDQVAQYFAELFGRTDGPLTFRLVLQPLVATFLGVRAGIRDARAGAPIYGWELVSNPAHRRDLVEAGHRRHVGIGVRVEVVFLVQARAELRIRVRIELAPILAQVVVVFLLILRRDALGAFAGPLAGQARATLRGFKRG